MRKKTKRRLSRILSLAMAVLFLAAVPVTEVAAAEERPGDQEVEILETVICEVQRGENTPSLMTSFTSCFINVSNENGAMRVEINTAVNGTASVIGVKDIVIKKKVWYGWKTVATGSGVKTENAGAVGCSFLYENAERGATYIISYTHFANVDEYKEFPTDSGEFTFNM